jgi:hypothetical protein
MTADRSDICIDGVPELLKIAEYVVVLPEAERMQELME